MEQILSREIKMLTDALGQNVGSLDVLIEKAATEINRLKSHVAALGGGRNRIHIGNIAEAGGFPNVPAKAEVFAEWN